MLFALFSTSTLATIDGLAGTRFALTAKAASISLPDGSQPLMWGYAPDASGVMQYPAPTLLVNQAQRDLTTAELEEARSQVNNIKAYLELYRFEGTALTRVGVKPVMIAPGSGIRYK